MTERNEQLAAATARVKELEESAPYRVSIQCMGERDGWKDRAIAAERASGDKAAECERLEKHAVAEESLRRTLYRQLEAAERASGEKAAEAEKTSSEWEDEEDEWTPLIQEAFPTRSGSHNEYALAMQMISSRHSKGSLVALVNWLLVKQNKRYSE
jgi:hypothetical protein